MTATAARVVDDRPHLFGMRPEDLLAFLRARNVDATISDCRRVLSAVIAEGRERVETRRPIARSVRLAVEELCARHPVTIVERVQDDADQFEKLLIALDDGALVEAVKIPLAKPGRYTVCLSSQVGCAMQCGFCATGRLGYTRNLTAAEMVRCFVAVRAITDGHLAGAVFQGQGEPFQNYDEVVQAAAVLSEPAGGRIDARAITISTVGVVAGIRRYAKEGRKHRVIVSLTSAIEEKRRALLPVAGRVPLAELKDAIAELHRATGERVTLAWVLMKGVNDGVDEVDALARVFADVPIRVNLIDVNDARADGFVPVDEDGLARFRDALAARRIPFIRRYSGGKNRHAGCGMLSRARALPVVDGA